jgi:hypothetical protein
MSIPTLKKTPKEGNCLLRHVKNCRYEEDAEQDNNSNNSNSQPEKILDLDLNCGAEG